MRTHVTWGLCVLISGMLVACEKEEPPSSSKREGLLSSTPHHSTDQHSSQEGASFGEVQAGFARQPNEFLDLVDPIRPPMEIELVSAAVEAEPVIDGKGNDPAWSHAKAITTLDRSSQQEIELKSVHTSHKIFLLVSFADEAASQTHKTWVWDHQEGIYKQGPDREDMCALKWSLDGLDANLSIYRNPQPHHADIWFWKACRTNPMGYADDKSQLLSKTKAPKTAIIQASDGSALYFSRKGDQGTSAYAELMPVDFDGPTKPRFATRKPEGSRADVQAKGRWNEGRWTIEFARELSTGHPDDLEMKINGRYLLGVSRYEMSRTEPNPDWTQPLYKSGDVFDRIVLWIAE